MRPLTQEEINNLEARGIKPGVIVSCANDSEVKYSVLSWDKYEFDKKRCITSIIPESSSYSGRGGFLYHFLYDSRTETYATPIQ